MFLGRVGSRERWLVAGAWTEEGERGLAPEQGLAIVREATRSGAALLGRIASLLADAAGWRGRSQLEQWQRLEASLRRRELSVVEIEGPLPHYSHEFTRPPERHEPAPLEPVGDAFADEPAKPPELAQLLVPLRVRVVEDDGWAVVDLPLECGEASEPQRSTGAGGVAQFEQLQPGDASLRIVTIAEVAWGPGEQRGTHALARADEREARLRLDLEQLLDTEVAVSTYPGTCLVLERPCLRRVEPDLARFDHGSALLVPAPWTGDRHPLAAVVHGLVALLDEPERWLVIIGHASAPGGADKNQQLSEHRADAIRAIVEGDESAWVEHARERGSLRDVLAYIDYLGRRRGWSSCTLDEPVAEQGTGETERSRAAVSGFQQGYNARFAGALKVDGVCGNKTLAALFAVIRDEFERWLAKLGASADELPLDRVVYLGHGTTLSGREAGGEDPEAADRVVDLIIVEGLEFDGGITPERLYQSEIARRGRYPLPDEPDDWAAGPFTIVSDLTPDEPAEPETYELRSHDGAWAEERELPKQGTIEAGELVLRFPALPTEYRYTLTVTSSSGKRSVIFEDVAYGDLHRVSPKLGD